MKINKATTNKGHSENTFPDSTPKLLYQDKQKTTNRLVSIQLIINPEIKSLESQ